MPYLYCLTCFFSFALNFSLFAVSYNCVDTKESNNYRTLNLNNNRYEKGNNDYGNGVDGINNVVC